MEKEMEELKSVFRALVVSSPTRIDAMSLLRDYKNMIGLPVPMRKFGYTDPVKFLRENFHDCFVFQGSSTNPELTLIVPDELQHLDKFVQKQRIGPSLKHKGKRRSVPEHLMTPAQNSIASTFMKKNNAPLQAPGAYKADTHQYTPRPPSRPPLTNRSNTQVFKGKDSDKDIHKRDSGNFRVQDKERASAQSRDSGMDAENESGRLTPLSSSSSRKLGLEQLKREISEIIADHPKGVWCIDLLGLYKERHSRELNFLRFGYTSLVGVASEADGVLALHYPERSDYLLIDRAHAAASPPPAPRPRRDPRLYARPSTPVDLDDALPGIPYDPEVFPEDCMGLLDSIPAASLAGISVSASLPVTVGEVYSPSHFWMLRLGADHYTALDNIMNEMNKYYASEEGRSRRLLPGNVRVGYYCSSRYEGDWHRSLIVKILDSTTVKVRHVDYGTVERCAVSELRLLPRRWAALPAQALRARMTAVRPYAAGRRWPIPATERFLEHVRDRRLIAVVCALDLQDDILEVYLVNTSTDEDVCIGDELVSTGHAEPAVVGCATGVNDFYGLAPLGPRGDSDSDPDLDVDPVPVEPSESASQVAGAAPSISPWTCSSDDEEDGSVLTHTTGTSTFSSIVLRHKLHVLRAAHLARARSATDDVDSVVTATDAASTVLAGGSSSSQATPVPRATLALSPLAARSPDDSHAADRARSETETRTEPNAVPSILSASSVLASKLRALRACDAPDDSASVASCVSSASVTLQRILALHKKNAETVSRG